MMPSRGRNERDRPVEPDLVAPKEKQGLLSKDFAAEPRRKRPRRRANDLDGKRWQRYSISIWSDIEKSPEERRLRHPAMFPSMLAERLIECFTRSDERVVLDPFLGSGSTLVACRRMGKKGIGFEVYHQYAELARRRLESDPLLRETAAAEEDDCIIIEADARELRRFVEPDSVDFCVTSPPYWDILSQQRTADGKDTRDYGQAENDLSRISDYWEFINALCDVFAQVLEVLKPGKYCVVNVMDIRKKDVLYPFHSDLARNIERLGFIFDDMIIWDRRHEYNNLRPLGYPSVFRINRVHEFLLIFKKPDRKRKMR